MNRLGAQGGSMFTARIVRGFPQTPMTDVFPLRLYGQFEPCIPHFIALRHLIQQRGGLEEIPAGISVELRESSDLSDLLPDQLKRPGVADARNSLIPSI
jgi:hypothetical protein